MKLKIRYENERGTPCPKRVALKGEVGPPTHPRLWWIIVTEPLTSTKFKKWLNDWVKNHQMLSAPEIAIAMRNLEYVLGVTDPFSINNWKEHGVEELNYANPSGFVNWPDPDLGKVWEGTNEII